MVDAGTTPGGKRRAARDAVVLFVVALAVRLFYLWRIQDLPFVHAPLVDGAFYDAWARRIASGEWWDSEVFFLAPLYPYVLAGWYVLFGHSLGAVHIVQMILGAGSCVLIYSAGRRMFDRRAGLAAGAILAVYPPAIFYDGLIHKAGLLLFLTALFLDRIAAAIARGGAKRWLLCGIVAGLLALTQENMLMLVVVIPVWILLRAGPSPTRGRAAGAFLVGMGALLTVVAARNYSVGSVFALTTSNAGQNFFIGNNRGATGLYESLSSGRQNPAQELEDATRLAEQSLGRELTAGEVSSYWLRRGLEFVREQPAAWVKLLVRKGLLTWNRFEAPDADDLTTYADWSGVLRIPAIVLHFGVLAPLGLAGWTLARGRRGMGELLGWLMIALTLAIALFFVFGRYRLPLVAILALCIGAGATELMTSWRTWPRSRLAWAGSVLVVSAVMTNWSWVDERAFHSIGRVNLGSALRQAGRFDEAERQLRSAIDAYGDNALAYHQLGLVELRRGRSSEAEANLAKAAAIAPDLADTHLALARLHVEQGRGDAATARYREVLRLRPGDEVARGELAQLAGPREDRSSNGSEFDVLMNQAADAAGRGAFVEATEAFQRAGLVRPEDARPILGLAGVLIAAQRPREAIPHLRRALTLDPGAAVAHAELGRLLADEGDFPAAIEHDQHALGIDPKSISTRYNLATALASVGRLGEAVEAMQTCLTLARDAGRSELIPRIEDRLVRLRAERDRG